MLYINTIYIYIHNLYIYIYIYNVGAEVSVRVGAAGRPPRMPRSTSCDRYHYVSDIIV